MSWKEDLKKLLNIPENAEILTRPYYREIPKKGGKRYKALTIQYVHNGKRKYKHISKEKAALIESLVSGEDAVLEHVQAKLEEIKKFLSSVPNENTKRNLSPLIKEIDRLLIKIYSRIF